MDFKKMASEAGTLFNRAKQYTEEKLGHAERTELDPQLENLVQRGDKTKQWTEQILHQTEAVLQPNPNVRMEEFLYEKVQGKKPIRLVESDILGQCMIDAGNDVAGNTPYGSSLTRVGQTQQKLGQAQRDFIKNAAANFLQPFAGFLEGDMKTIQKERKVLESKRLDLDAAKSKLKRARTQPAKDGEGDVIGRAETELRVAQTEFDRQCEVTRLLLEGLGGAYAHHQRCLHDFVEAQATYYAQCNQYMNDLQRQLGFVGAVNNDTSSRINVVDSRIFTGGFAGATAGSTNNSGSTNENGGGQKARVLYDYDAADMTELSLAADEVIVVRPLLNHNSADWMLGVRGRQSGKIPTAYIAIID